MRNTHTTRRQLVDRLEEKYQTKLRLQQNQTVFHMLWDKMTDSRSKHGNKRPSKLYGLGGYEYIAR